MDVRLRELLAYVLELQPAEITRDSAQDKVEGWDSMRQIILLSVLEQEYGITFDAAEQDRMRTAGGIQDVLVSRELIQSPR